MKPMPLTIVKLTVLIMMLVITGCSDSTTDPVTKEEPKGERPGFTATVTGAVNGEVSGVGIVTYLPPKERDIVAGKRPGYYMLVKTYPQIPQKEDHL